MEKKLIVKEKVLQIIQVGGSERIFDFGDATNGSIEDPNSNFNQHRLAVIRYSIEKNLSIAIANYNNYTDVKANFQMPELKEDEWSKIINNISIISFLQGLNIGGKVYNGYSIINNTKNNEYVSEDSIYLADNADNGNYYKITDETEHILEAEVNLPDGGEQPENGGQAGIWNCKGEDHG